MGDINKEGDTVAIEVRFYSIVEYSGKQYWDRMREIPYGSTAPTRKEALQNMVTFLNKKIEEIE